MVEAASLRITQQQIINKFLTAYFGKRIVISEREIAKLIEDYVPYLKHELTDLNRCLVIVWHRKISELIKFHFSKLMRRDILVSLKKVELCLGGDHGKENYLFIAVLLFCYEGGKDTYRLELKLG